MEENIKFRVQPEEIEISQSYKQQNRLPSIRKESIFKFQNQQISTKQEENNLNSENDYKSTCFNYYPNSFSSRTEYETTKQNQQEEIQEQKTVANVEYLDKQDQEKEKSQNSAIGNLEHQFVQQIKIKKPQWFSDFFGQNYVNVQRSISMREDEANIEICFA